jgi:cbb3-type cytochrome oxidase maturation protein
MMNEATIVLTIMTLLILAIFLGFFIWGIKSRQFKDIEGAKYNMLKDDKEEVEQGSGKTSGEK